MGYRQTTSKNSMERKYYELCRAIVYGDFEATQRSISENMVVNHPEIKKVSPLYFAVSLNNLDIARLLLEAGAAANQDASLGRESALITAIYRDQGQKSLVMMELLLKFGLQSILPHWGKEKSTRVQKSVLHCTFSVNRGDSRRWNYWCDLLLMLTTVINLEIRRYSRQWIWMSGKCISNF